MTSNEKPTRKGLRQAAKGEPGGTGRKRGSGTMGQRGIEVTGNGQIDTATAEIALALRSGHPGRPDQYYYDWATRLRDEIMAGTMETMGEDNE